MVQTITNSTQIIMSSTRFIYDDLLADAVTRVLEDFDYDRRLRELREAQAEIRRHLMFVYRPPPAELSMSTLPPLLEQRRPLQAGRGVVWLARAQGNPRARRSRRRRVRAWED